MIKPVTEELAAVMTSYREFEEPVCKLGGLDPRRNAAANRVGDVG